MNDVPDGGRSMVRDRRASGHWLRLASIGLAAAALAACDPGALVGSPPPTFDGAPTAVAERASVPFCGEEFIGLPDPAPNVEARKCFWEAYETRQPAEFVTTNTTMEGDPITTIYRIAPGPTLEIFIDSTKDKWSAMAWLQLDCPGLALDPDSAAQPAFGPDGECRETVISR